MLVMYVNVENASCVTHHDLRKGVPIDSVGLGDPSQHSASVLGRSLCSRSVFLKVWRLIAPANTLAVLCPRQVLRTLSIVFESDLKTLKITNSTSLQA